MATQIPFRPKSGASTDSLPATTTASTAAQITGRSSGAEMQIRVRNTSSTITGYVAFGGSGVVAVIPATGTPANGVGLGPGAVEVLTVATNTYISVIAASSTTSFEVTVGEGI